MITKTPKLPMRADFSGVKAGLRVQANADGGCLVRGRADNEKWNLDLVFVN